VPEKQRDNKDAEHARLVTEPEFEAALKKVLSVTKKESDEQMARFQASNQARRKAKTKD